MENNSKSSLGFLSLLGLAFIILKLCNVINWSWWLVLLPLWGGAALGIGILIIAAIIYILKRP